MPRQKAEKTEEVVKETMNPNEISVDEINSEEDIITDGENVVAEITDDESEDNEKDEIADILAVLEKAFEKRRFKTLTPEERRKAYKNEKVSGKKGNYKTDKDLIKEEAKELLAAAQSRPRVTLLKGIVDGYEYTEHGIPLVLVTRPNKPNFVIKIPVSQFMMYDEKQYTGVAGKRALEHELNSRINSEIEFVAYAPDEENLVALGSRLKAMEIRSKINYKKKAGKEKPDIVEGSRVAAKVVSVKQGSVKVEISGIETTIRSDELSWKALESLTQEFSVGDEFEVIIHNIEEIVYESLGQKYRLFTAKASKREAEPNPAEKYFDQFKVGQRLGGTIKVHNEFGVFVDLRGKIDALCPPPAVGAIVRGSKCIIEITEKDENKKRLYGRFV